MKFSLIVPVYNVEKYITKCLDSICNQSYKNFEVIIVCDRCDDRSENIVDNYVKRYSFIRKVSVTRTGLSKSRNIGLENATGDYILFIDSDDYIEKDLLNILNEKLKENKADLIRFECNIVDDNYNVIQKINGINYSKIIDYDVIKELLNRIYFEPAWLYCYNTDFWKNNNFNYAEGMLHEDLGLTPYILYKAKNISSIDYNGYNYVQRNGSLSSTKSYEKDKKKAYDVLEQFKVFLKNIDIDKKSFLLIMFYVCAVYNKSKLLNKCDKKKYLKELKSTKYYKYLYNKEFMFRIKSMIIRINLKLYSKIFWRQ